MDSLQKNLQSTKAFDIYAILLEPIEDFYFIMLPVILPEVLP